MITIEQIDEFRKRTHSSYEDAKFFSKKITVIFWTQ